MILDSFATNAHSMADSLTPVIGRLTKNIGVDGSRRRGE